jgi:AbrB family looped-hinge helix DNA binding protein
MRISEIVRIDSRGRVVMPSTMRDALGLSEGMYIMIIADLDKKEARLIPFADPEARLTQFRMTIPDVPGALARAATFLAEHGVDLLSSESRTLHRGESAEWYVIADVSKCKCKLEELKQKIEKESVVKEMEYKGFP